ncbi:hypothetical protein O181_031800 [Austropuccinia psidii MF-1]|uniref:Carbohydrate esterase family 16 protein n=1 Tax=Austropuccinia psidii MF-1 TaxID=1389203 RepID=A0A9Q3H7L8_9BASI|nr:hypothetical protein [Austropuccinia psidii MF-1]
MPTEIREVIPQFSSTTPLLVWLAFFCAVPDLSYVLSASKALTADSLFISVDPLKFIMMPNFRSLAVSYSLILALFNVKYISSETKTRVASKPEPDFHAHLGSQFAVIFGASYCDDAHPRPPKYAGTLKGAPYFQGRASNGKVFVEYLAQKTLTGHNISLFNYAYIGSTISNTIVTVSAPTLTEQINTYLDDVSHKRVQHDPTKRLLYCSWFGINDVTQIWTELVKQASNHSHATPEDFRLATRRVNEKVADMISKIEALQKNPDITKPQSDFLLILLPPLEIVPNLYYQARDLAKRSTDLTAKYLEYIHILTNQFNKEVKRLVATHKSIKLFDAEAFWRTVRKAPRQFGLDNVTQACWNSTSGQTCSQPNRFQYWDTLHPTTAMHELIAQEITKVLNP